MGEGLIRSLFVGLNHLPLVCKLSQRVLADPSLVTRLKRFLLVGITTSTIQFGALSYLNSRGVWWFWALLMTGSPAIIVSYIISVRLIWGEQTHKPEKRRVFWHAIMFLPFLASKGTTLLKTAITGVLQWRGIPFPIAWLITQGALAICSFILAERFVFGPRTQKVASRLAGERSNTFTDDPNIT